MEIVEIDEQIEGVLDRRHTSFLNLVAGFDALGRLIAVGLIMFARRGKLLGARVVVPERGEQRISVGLRFSRSLVSYRLELPSGAGDLMAELGHLASLTLGPRDSLRALCPARPCRGLSSVRLADLSRAPSHRF